jgi:RHS repeat-associated protein
LKWIYAYDNVNHLTQATQYRYSGGVWSLSQQVTYQYDVFGNRVEEDIYTASNNTTTATKFAYSLTSELDHPRGSANGAVNSWADLNTSNQLIMRHFFLDSLDSIFARMDSSGNVAWHLADHHESIRGLMNNSGSLIDQTTYDAWGNISSESSPSNGDRYKFDSGEYSPVTGLYHFGARYYGPAIGRFVSQDPLGFIAGDTNLGRYVGNDPTNDLDPLGLADLTVTTPQNSPFGAPGQGLVINSSRPIQVKQWMQVEASPIWSCPSQDENGNPCSEQVIGGPIPPTKPNQSLSPPHPDHTHPPTTPNKPQPQPDMAGHPFSTKPEGIPLPPPMGDPSTYWDYPTLPQGAASGPAQQFVQDAKPKPPAAGCKLVGVVVVERFVTVVYEGGQPVYTVYWTASSQAMFGQQGSSVTTQIIQQGPGQPLVPKPTKPGQPQQMVPLQPPGAGSTGSAAVDPTYAGQVIKQCYLNQLDLSKPPPERPLD